ncbi:pyruvate kinase [Methanocella sp. CWC-04]|uniref:pyruvate kinase n=1 Tax=Methanooceanicella nereidis TaxID=2052831 RepID=A0AAP2RF35_9EURY|nr:pyruvate kinase [Methanocella sp. CWC-04]
MVLTSYEWDRDQLEKIIEELESILLEMVKLETSFNEFLEKIHPTYRDSAINFLHYLALRQKDIRELQENLAHLGISSLGRAESHVMDNISSILKILYYLNGRHGRSPMISKNLIKYEDGKRLLEHHTNGLIGDRTAKRDTRIMVTMPSEAANDYRLVRDLLASGMDCMRINCAYDDVDAWARMISSLRRAERELKKTCRVSMDLAGHKLRTGPVEPAPAVIRWSPRQDGYGRVMAPARIWLTPMEYCAQAPTDTDASLPVPVKWLSGINIGDVVKFNDTRDRSRRLKIADSFEECKLAECYKSAYVIENTVMHHYVSGDEDSEPIDAQVGKLPENERYIVLKKGETLIMTEDRTPGTAAVRDEAGNVVIPATIGVTMPEIFSRVKPGERVWIDDGKIGGIIRHVNKNHMHVEITHARPRGEKLRGSKGINLPDSRLDLPPLTKKDVEDLAFISHNADIVGFSFVNSASGVYELQSRLKELGGDNLGILLKIETVSAFEHLPELLLAAMRSPGAGVMIARGDLAVECGYERMAEVQEEILWFCEAAHMPVVWATQVLEKLAKKGMPSRAEITDAAMGVRAECVMLNKGAYIVEAARTLDDILMRMQVHQKKKRSMLRKLDLAKRFKVLKENVEKPDRN